MKIIIRRILIFCRNILSLFCKYKEYSVVKRIRIIFDYLKLYRLKGLTVDEYYEFEFEKRSQVFRDDFLGWEEQGYYLRILNPVKYYTLARNKYLSHLCLEEVGVPMPKLLAYYNKYCKEAKLQFGCDLLKLKAENKVPFVIRATEASHGEGVFFVVDVFKENDEVCFSLANGEKVLLNDFLECKEELIVESVIKQTEQISRFNSSSINTIRFMTTLFPNGEAEIIATFIKIGRAGKSVDNAGDGGNVDVCIDVETGELKHAIQYDGWRKITEIDKHPDSGAHLNGVVIENWNEIKSAVIKFQEKLPFVKAAGWDIAITDNGPIVIEVNDSWDRIGQYFIRRGWKNEIKECFNAWVNVEYDPKVERFINNKSVKYLDKLKKKYK